MMLMMMMMIIRPSSTNNNGNKNNIENNLILFMSANTKTAKSGNEEEPSLSERSANDTTDSFANSNRASSYRMWRATSNRPSSFAPLLVSRLFLGISEEATRDFKFPETTKATRQRKNRQSVVTAWNCPKWSR